MLPSTGPAGGDRPVRVDRLAAVEPLSSAEVARPSRANCYWLVLAVALQAAWLAFLAAMVLKS